MNAQEFRQRSTSLIRQLSNRANGIFSAVTDRYGLTPMQARILRLVYQQGTVKVGDMAKCIALASGNASSICKKMEQQGFLQRTRSEEDERVVLLSLTEKGRATASTLEADIERMIDRLLISYPQERLDRILDGLQELCNIFETMNCQNSVD